MPRLPIPGQDSGTWGDILNEYLSQSHATDGSLKADSVGSAQLQDNSVTGSTIAPNTITNAQIASDAVNATSIADGSIVNGLIADGTIQEVKLSSALQVKLNSGTASPDWTSIINKPVIIAAGATQAAAKAVLGLDKSDVGLSNIDNTSDLNKPISTAAQTALDAKADLVGGKIPTAQIPALALTEVVTVTDQTAMLALTTSQVQPGDIAVRTDGTGTFVLTAADPSVLANWTKLNAPTDAVTSVNGHTGTVVLDKSDVGLTNIDNTSDLNKPISTAGQTALDAKADLVGGKIPSSQLPAIALTDVVTVASQAAMLALTAGEVQPGDVAVRSDGAGTFILSDTDPSILANWILLNSPSDAVSSVNGQTGTVSLTKADVGLGNVDNTSDVTKNSAIVTLTNKTIDGGSNTLQNIPQSAITGLSTDLTDKQTKFITGTVATASGTAAKTVTLDSPWTSYTPQTGDWFLLTFTSGNSANTATLAVNGGTACPITATSGSTTATNFSVTSGAAVLLRFDGTNFRHPSTQGTISQSNLLSSSSSVGGSITGALAEALLVQEASTARTLTNKTITSIQLTGDTTIAQSGAIALYNTADQTTNYERVRQYWNSNTAYISAENGGTGVSRNLFVGVANGARGITVSGSPSSNGRIQMTENTTLGGSVGMSLSSTFTTTTGTNIGLSVATTLNQSSTAGYTALLINTTETATGSGNKYLADFQIGGTSKTRIDNTGTHTLSSGAGLVNYNTTDETTNYEKLTQAWSSNVYTIFTSIGGTSTARTLRLGTSATVGGTTPTRYFELYPGGSKLFAYTAPHSVAGNVVDHSGVTLSGANVAQVVTAINPTINQSGTSSYTALLVNPTETATGSGARLLADFQVGGTSKTRIDYAGIHYFSAGAGTVTYNTVDETTNYERVSTYWAGNQYVISSAFGGTASQRAIKLQSHGSITLNANATGGSIQLADSTAGVGSTVAIASVSGTLTGASSFQGGLIISPTLNQSSTASYTALLINPTETATGSGTKNLMDLQVAGTSRTRIDNLGNHTISSAATSGLALYNTTDETTNYEKAVYRYTSNILEVGHVYGGTGSSRVARFGTASTNGGTLNRYIQFQSSTPMISYNWGGTVLTGQMINIGSGNSWTASSGNQTALGIDPTVNQSGTAGYTALLVNPTETATGSGTKILIDAQVGGLSKFKVDNTGAITVASVGTASGSLVSVDGAQTLTNKTISASSNTITGLRAVTTTSGNYTAGSASGVDYVYLIAGAHSGTLPSASGNTSRYTFKNNHAASVTITAGGSDTIDGAASISIVPGSSVDLISNGTNAWSVI